MSGFWVKLAKQQSKSQIKRYELLKDLGQDVLTPSEQWQRGLVFLHGAGNSTEMYHNLFQSDFSPVCAKTKVILPQAPLRQISIAKSSLKMPSWYDIFHLDRSKREPSDVYNLEELRMSVERVHAILDAQLLENPTITSRDLFVGGISQGCALALHAGLTYTKPLGGIIALSGYHINTCKINKANAETHIYMSHGAADDIVKPKYMESTVKFLQFSNPNFQIHYEEGLGHTIEEQQMLKINQWYRDLQTAQ